MKAPTTKSPKTPAPKKSPPKKDDDGGFKLSQAMDLAATSVDALTAYADYKKEVEVTTRSKIEGQKAIILSEHDLEKARLEHTTRMVELDNQDKNSMRNHEQEMASLAQEDRKLSSKDDLHDRVLKQLEAKEFTAEEAALLLYGTQE
ncbi:hypothetical protein [Thalassospira sp. MCCC 1A01428]|uniref:hypothetical protein n=1 Tax=Thalassospira sp. MCCC 1A01428 TaxID=1470575 RepID=UPI000A1EE93D|nr:hypothetical protein [Thalassospira sp. MCCC 1A01428]OSQ33808.1 hypothetical protein THS27_25940 [Thalassospira sp. MCCC 1A01428]